MYIDVRDHLRNSIQVTFSLDSTFGDVRNAVNCCLPPGFVVTEFELVPAPFAHYIEDDPECFKGPADEWYIVDVFFDDIAAGLERCEKDETVENLVVCLRLVSIAPLGPPHRVGVLFPGERDLDAAAVEALLSKPEGEHALRLLTAAAEVRGYDLRKAFASGSRSDARAKRDATIVMSLATVEMRMKLRGDGELKSQMPAWAHTPLLPSGVMGVAGFGVAGECAALVFAGALTLEEAFESGTLVRKSRGVVCACTPAKRFKASWGPKANEWPIPQTVRNVPKRSRWTPAAAADEVDQNGAEVCRFSTFRHVSVLKTFISIHTHFGTLQSHTS